MCEEEEEEEKVCVAMYVDGTSHSSVCPGFDTVRARCTVRLGRIKTAHCLKEEVQRAPLSASFGRGSCLERSLEYFVRPRVFLDTSRGSSVSVCDCVSVFVYLKHVGIDSLRTTNEHLIINQVFHAHVNFIITDTCICSEGFAHMHGERLCIHTHTHSTTRIQPSLQNCHR